MNKLSEKQFIRKAEIAERLFTISEYVVELDGQVFSVKYNRKRHDRFALKVYVVLIGIIGLGIYVWFAVAQWYYAFFFLGVFILGLLYIQNVNNKVNQFLLKIDNINQNLVVCNYLTSYRQIEIPFEKIHSLFVKYNTLKSELTYYLGAVYLVDDEGKDTFLIEFQSSALEKFVKRQAEQFKRFIENLNQQ